MSLVNYNGTMPILKSAPKNSRPVNTSEQEINNEVNIREEENYFSNGFENYENDYNNNKFENYNFGTNKERDEIHKNLIILRGYISGTFEKKHGVGSLFHILQPKNGDINFIKIKNKKLTNFAKNYNNKRFNAKNLTSLFENIKEEVERTKQSFITQREMEYPTFKSLYKKYKNDTIAQQKQIKGIQAVNKRYQPLFDLIDKILASVTKILKNNISKR